MGRRNPSYTNTDFSYIAKAESLLLENNALSASTPGLTVVYWLVDFGSPESRQPAQEQPGANRHSTIKLVFQLFWKQMDVT